MKTHLMRVALVALVAACGGPVQQEPAPTRVEEALELGGTECGPNVCGSGYVCCNESCGTCAPKGGACPDVMCDFAQADVEAQARPEPTASALSTGGACGENYCGKGYFCCNPGCGVCAPEGGGCPDVMCD